MDEAKAVSEVAGELTAEPGPLPGRRRSWKRHRVTADRDLYACDQCDKMFGKQSSLARHKYEHSGETSSSARF